MSTKMDSKASESSPEKILRTFSGDSFGNVQTDGSSSGMICDENKTSDDNELNYVVRTDSDKDQIQRTSLRDDDDKNENSLMQDGNEIQNIKGIDVSQPNEPSGDVEDDAQDLVIINNNGFENDINGIVEGGGNEAPVAEEDAPCKDDNEGDNDNDGSDMDYSKGDTKENIPLFVNGESRMEEYVGDHKPIRKFHSIHLIPEAFEEDLGDDDRNSQFSSYDGDDAESDVVPVMLNANCISARSDNRPPTTSTMCELPGGLRAKANTPASFYNNNDVDTPGRHSEKVSGRLSSRESRDEVFNRAMTLMSNRCTSARGGENGLFSNREPPYGVHIPQYFFVYQKKPQPLAPLKAWRGYKGNVYFEPMRIQRVSDSDGGLEYQDNNNNNNNNDDVHNNNNNNLSRQHPQHQQHHQQPPSRSMLRSAPLPQSRGSNSTSRGLLSSSASSRPSYRLVNSSTNPVYVMDKSVVMNQQNSNELRFIEGVESTGSLALSQQLGISPYHQPPNQTDYMNNEADSNNNINSNNPFMARNSILQPNKDKRLMNKRDRICRGSNFHKSKDKSELAMSNRNNNKVFSIKISDPKMKKLTTPDNSRRTSGVGSRMSVRKSTPGSANSNSNSNSRHNKSGSNQTRSMELVVSGDKFVHFPPSKPVTSSMHGRGSASSHRHLFPAAQDKISLDDVGAFINLSDNLPRVSQVHVTLGNNMAEESSLPATTPAYSDNESIDDGEGKDRVDFVDMNFKGLTTNTTTPVDSGY